MSKMKQLAASVDTHWSNLTPATWTALLEGIACIKSPNTIHISHLGDEFYSIRVPVVENQDDNVDEAAPSKAVPLPPKEHPVLSDTCRDTIDHALDGLNIKSIKYYETDDDEKSLTIIVKGNFDDEKQAEEFMHGTHKEEHDAYERAMKGI